MSQQKISGRKPKVIVVGGSFAGLAAVRYLRNDCDVILLEPRNYFEYTPGILHVLTGSKSHEHILSPMHVVSKGSKHIRGYVLGINPSEKKVLFHNLDDTTEKSTVEYDAIVWCTGSQYVSPIKPAVASYEISNRILELNDCEREIRNAESFLIVGGGLVGVELAAEVASRLNGKKVVLLSRSELLGALPPLAAKYSLDWLRRNRVEVILEDQVKEKVNNRTVITNQGRRIEADLCINCSGGGIDFKPLQLECLHESFTQRLHSRKEAATSAATSLHSFQWPLTKTQFIKVDQHLRAVDFPSNAGIFAAGDCVEHVEGVGFAASSKSTGIFGAKSSLPGVRNAHLAESQAELCAHNVKAFLALIAAGQQQVPPPVGDRLLSSTIFGGRGAGIALKRYPEDLFGSRLNPLLACVSLGPRDGIVIFNNIVLGGLLLSMMGGLVKFIIERSKISEIRNERWGRCFWAFGHIVSNQVHRCIVAWYDFKMWLNKRLRKPEAESFPGGSLAL